MNPMDSSDVLRKFEVFLGDEYQKQLVNAVKAETAVVVEFHDLEKFDPELADYFLERPQECIEAAEDAIESIDVGVEPSKRIHFRVSNIPESSEVLIRNIRSGHLGKFIAIRGIIKQASEVRPEITAATWECQACGEKMLLLQEKAMLQKPYMCECGNKRGFELVSRKLIDVQRIIVEESPELLEGGSQTRKIAVYLKDDMVDPTFQKRVVPGNEVIITGIVNDIPIRTDRGQETKKRDIYVDGNYLDTIVVEYEEIDITKDDEKAIKELAKTTRVFETLVASIAPSIYGYDKVKEAIALQLFGGHKRVMSDGMKRRGDIHILLVGDPGSGKSQILKYVSELAPKGRYVVGKSASGAGITAAAVKDEFTGHWALEAGALVLANRGLASVDEIDKMNPEDRSAMHEIMEQQSYHPGTEITLHTGNKVRIGVLVDRLIESNRDFLLKGTRDCDVLETGGLKVKTMAGGKQHTIEVSRVSRHKPPGKMYRITFSNGRTVTVTPEHPVLIWKDGITTVRADRVIGGEYVPGLRRMAAEHVNVELDDLGRGYPRQITPLLARLLGLIASEGHTYRGRTNRLSEIGVSNTRHELVMKAGAMMNNVFGKSAVTSRGAEKSVNTTKTLYMARVLSKNAYDYLGMNFPEIMSLSAERRVPARIMASENSVQTAFLEAYFHGDGFVDHNRVGYITASLKMAEDLQDMLLMNNIYSYIATEKRGDRLYYKVVVSGSQSIRSMMSLVGKDHRKGRIEEIYERSLRRKNDRDTVPPALVRRTREILKELRLLDGYFNKLLDNNNGSHAEKVKAYLSAAKERMSRPPLTVRELRKNLGIMVKEIARELGISVATYYNIEKRGGQRLGVVEEMAKRKKERLLERIDALLETIESTRFMRIQSAEEVETDCDWTYDITVEPTHNFISAGVLLHNTCTISKASIQATLSAQTTILAAANPKFGRFDAFQPVPAQINLPDTLISRFDLLFPIKDIPDKAQDKALAEHILTMQKDKGVREPPLDKTMLRKYVAYAKKKCRPVLTDSATAEIRDFYVGLRGQAAADEGSSIPLTARQLEALVRLAEASARVRLSDRVEREDSRRAVDLLTFCLQQVGMDTETGRFDIDRMISGTTSSQRNKIREILRIMKELQDESPSKRVAVQDLIARAEDEGIDGAEDIVDKLKKEGELFEPRQGFLRKV